MERMAFDQASQQSQRRVDENGFLHVSLCHISKEAVNEYYGSEIPGWQELGLEPERIYRGYRSGRELALGAATFNGLPLLDEHVRDSADQPRKDRRVGNLGTEACFAAPYLNNSLIIQDAEAIAALEAVSGKAARRELSASYRYDPVFAPGTFGKQAYDFVMTNIRGNHVALVEEGRAGHDVLVADEAIRDNPVTSTQRSIAMMETYDPVTQAALAASVEAMPSGGSAAQGGAPNPAALVSPADPPVSVASEAEDEENSILDELQACLAGLGDQNLAAQIRKLVDALCATRLVSDEGTLDPLLTPAAAMDRARKRRSASPQAAMDADAVAARVRAGLKAQIEAARNVRPLIGDVDPMAFDSAAQIYGRALHLVGRPTRVTDPVALKELCALACDARRQSPSYPVLNQAMHRKANLDPAFANLGSIRNA